MRCHLNSLLQRIIAARNNRPSRLAVREKLLKVTPDRPFLGRNERLHRLEGFLLLFGFPCLERIVVSLCDRGKCFWRNLGVYERAVVDPLWRRAAKNFLQVWGQDQT